MPQTIETVTLPQLPPDLPRRTWTRSECQRLEQAGLLDRERYELIAGELVRKMGKGPVHNVVVALFIEWLKSVYPTRSVLQEASIDPAPTMASINEPEPDAVVLRRPCTEFMAANAGPGDILLVAEVAVTTLAYDMGVKAALYAAAGMEEYWILDTTARRVIVHREPVGGSYRSVVEFAAHEPVSPLSAPTAQFRLADILG